VETKFYQRAAKFRIKFCLSLKIPAEDKRTLLRPGRSFKQIEIK